MLCESLQEWDVVHVPFLDTYAKVQHVNGLQVRLMTLQGEAVLTDRRNVKFINRTRKGLFDMAQEETVVSIRIEGGYLKKGAVVVTKGDLAAVNTFTADGDVDWNAIITRALGEIAAAEIIPLPDIQLTDETPAEVDGAAETDELEKVEVPAKPAKPKKAKKPESQPEVLKPVLAKPKERTVLEPLTTIPKQTKSLFDI
jgi:hypothetical protein